MLAVALVDQAVVLELDPRTLNIRRRFPTIQNPSQLVQTRQGLMVYSALQHEVVPVLPLRPGGLASVTVTNQHSFLSSNGQAVAIIGLDRVSVFLPGTATSTGTVRRSALPLDAPSSLLITDDGQVLVGNEGSIDRLR